MRMIDEDKVGLKEKPEDTRYIKSSKGTLLQDLRQKQGIILPLSGVTHLSRETSYYGTHLYILKHLAMGIFIYCKIVMDCHCVCDSW